jgi:Transcription factor Tfb4
MSLVVVLDASPAGWSRMRRIGDGSSAAVLPVMDEGAVAAGLARAAAGLVRAQRALTRCPRDPFSDSAAALSEGASAATDMSSTTGNVNVLLAGRRSLRWAFPMSLAPPSDGAAAGTALQRGQRAGVGQGISTEGAILQQLVAVIQEEETGAEVGGEDTAMRDDADGEVAPPASGEAALSGALAKALCFLSAAAKRAPARSGTHADSTSRVLLLTATREGPQDYIAFMNSAFAAEKLGVAVDVCVLDPDADSGAGLTQEQADHLPILLQVAHLTNGAYLRLPPAKLVSARLAAGAATEDEVSGAFAASLLQILVQWYLPPVSSRSQLSVPLAAHLDVDLRTSCFCHGTPLTHGHVCSVCLSVFCSRSDICGTCGTKYGVPLLTTTKAEATNTG